MPRSPAPGTPACARSGCWRARHCPEKACAVITLPPSLPAQAFALPGHTAAGRVSLAGQRTDRPGNDVPGSEPSPAQARTGYGCPIPRDEPAEPLSEPCAPIANATGCPACISMHCSHARRRPVMPRRALAVCPGVQSALNGRRCIAGWALGWGSRALLGKWRAGRHGRLPAAHEAQLTALELAAFQRPARRRSATGSLRGASLIAGLRRCRGTRKPACAAAVCGHK